MDLEVNHSRRAVPPIPFCHGPKGPRLQKQPPPRKIAIARSRPHETSQVQMQDLPDLLPGQVDVSVMLAANLNTKELKKKVQKI